MVEIIEVTDKKLMKKFVNFPLELYKGNPYYCPAFFPMSINCFSPRKT